MTLYKDRRQTDLVITVYASENFVCGGKTKCLIQIDEHLRNNFTSLLQDWSNRPFPTCLSLQTLVITAGNCTW